MNPMVLAPSPGARYRLPYLLLLLYLHRHLLGVHLLYLLRLLNHLRLLNRLLLNLLSLDLLNHHLSLFRFFVP